MKQRTKTLLRSSLLGGALLVVSVGSTVVLAQASGGTANTQTQAQQPSFTGSIPLPQDNQSEGAEAAAYAKMAKVTLDQAVTAAQSSLGDNSPATSAQLDNENGFLVWEVVIGQQAVKVDAGDAKVLQTEKVGANEEGDDNEAYAQGEQNEGGMEDGD